MIVGPTIAVLLNASEEPSFSRTTFTPVAAVNSGEKRSGIDPSYGAERFHRELLAIEFGCGCPEVTTMCRPRIRAVLVSIRTNPLTASS